MIRRWVCTAAVCIAAARLGAACARGGSGAADGRTVRGKPLGASSADTVDAPARARADSALAARNATLEPGALKTAVTALVMFWTGPGGRPFDVTIRTPSPASALARRFGTITLQNSLRTRSPNVGQYPCTSCHLGRRTAMADTRIADAHQNITGGHPKQTGGICSTCHSPDNVELLALKSGERVTLDHTYRLCAQCHFSQVTAWAAGAHGKRLDGWQGRRVVMGCADCHDPHKPALEPRIPFRAPQIERIRGHDQ